MATPYGIDMGNVLNFKMAADRHKMQKQQFDQDQEDRVAARSRNALLQNVRGQAVQGAPGAMQQLVTMDPQQAEQVMQYLSSAKEEERELMAEMNDNAGRMAAVVLSSDNPQRAYEMYRSSVPESARAEMPEEYDETFVKLQLARAREIDDLLKNPEIKTFGGEDMMMQDGRVIARTASENALNRQQPEEYTLSPGSVRMRGEQPIADNPRPADPAAGLNSSDESLMFRQSVELLGGLFDANDNVRAMDPNLRAKAQAITSYASELFKQGNMTRSQAVEAAAIAMGEVIPGRPGQGAPAVPPPPEAVNFLRRNPSTEMVRQFESKYGPGSARQFIN